MRTSFTMTQAQMDELLSHMKPVPYIVVGGCLPRSPQENANDAWCRLGDVMGFDGMSVQPGNGPLNFTAEPKQVVAPTPCDPAPVVEVPPVEEARDILRSYLRGNDAASLERALDLLEKSL